MRQTILEELGAKPTIVIVRLRSLGDTVLTTPAIAVLREAVPQASIHVVIEQRFAGILRGHPHIDGTLTISHQAGPAEKFRLIRRLRRLRPDLSLNLHGGSTSAWLTLLSGARFRVGFEHYRNAWAYNARIPRAQTVLHRAPDASVHTAEHHIAAAVFLGAPARVFPSARLACDPASEPAQPYAVLHPTAATFTKQWSTEGFRSLARMIRDQHHLKPVLLAGPGEEVIFQEFSDFECVGPLELDKLKSLLSGARLFVGNDSGPAHIAAAFGVPCAVIFGSSSSSIWRPWKTKHRVVETSWDCKPCPGDRCYEYNEPKCILSVETSAVERAVSDLLSP